MRTYIRATIYEELQLSKSVDIGSAFWSISFVGLLLDFVPLWVR